MYTVCLLLWIVFQGVIVRKKHKSPPVLARGLCTVLHLRWIGAQQNFTLLYHKSGFLHREQNIHELLKRCKKGKIPGFNALGSRLLPQIHSYIHKKFVSACYGGGGESRTRVRKPIHTPFYERSLLLKFPLFTDNKRTVRRGSFIKP